MKVFYSEKENMKRVTKFLALSAFLLASQNIFAKKAEVAEEKDLYEYNNIVANITKASEPKVLDKMVIFTAEAGPRYVGIAFDFEDYKKVHSFVRHVCRDIDGNITSEVLFYILERPAQLTHLDYRLVIDGLWTRDPLNDKMRYDENSGISLYCLEIGEKLPVLTGASQEEGVKFIYRGESGLQVRLAGSFTAWDSWIYELTETSEGFYELTLPLPQGKYYYNYFIGMNRLVDTSNPKRAYTEDGRVSSVIVVN